jgi:hypothetical protein
LFPTSLLPGHYSHGDGLTGCALTLTADHQFRFAHYTDDAGLIIVTDNHVIYRSPGMKPLEGHWRLDGDRVILEPRRPYPNLGPDRLNVRFIPVKWAERVYLVDENEMPGFCADAGSKSPIAYLRDQPDPSYFDYLKNPKHWPPHGPLYPALPADSRPVLPRRYWTFYDRGDMRAKVLRVVEESNGPKSKEQRQATATTTRILLNRGSLDRVILGMRLARLYNDVERLGELDYQMSVDRGPADAVVTQVSPHRSVAVLVTFPESGPSKVCRGDTFTSGDYFNRPSGTGSPWPSWVSAASGGSAAYP